MTAARFAQLQPRNDDLAAVPSNLVQSDVWGDEDYTVILLDGDFPDGLELRSVLQSVGVQVHIGPHTVLSDEVPVILVHARNRHRAEVALRMDVARRIFPDAAIGFVTGERSASMPIHAYSDARVVLGAAGIGFVSSPRRP